MYPWNTKTKPRFVEPKFGTKRAYHLICSAYFKQKMPGKGMIRMYAEDKEPDLGFQVNIINPEP